MVNIKVLSDHNCIHCRLSCKSVAGLKRHLNFCKNRPSTPTSTKSLVNLSEEESPRSRSTRKLPVIPSDSKTKCMQETITNHDFLGIDQFNYDGVNCPDLPPFTPVNYQQKSWKSMSWHSQT